MIALIGLTYVLWTAGFHRFIKMPPSYFPFLFKTLGDTPDVGPIRKPNFQSLQNHFEITRSRTFRFLFFMFKMLRYVEQCLLKQTETLLHSCLSCSISALDKSRGPDLVGILKVPKKTKSNCRTQTSKSLVF